MPSLLAPGLAFLTGDSLHDLVVLIYHRFLRSRLLLLAIPDHIRSTLQCTRSFDDLPMRPVPRFLVSGTQLFCIWPGTEPWGFGPCMCMIVLDTQHDTHGTNCKTHLNGTLISDTISYLSAK